MLDTLSATAESLQKGLEAGTLKSTQIVEAYSEFIQKHNGYLNAVSGLAADAMARAQQLDKLRSQGTTLGPLHGIPILIKDSINTEPSMGMGTTGGALALVGAEPPGNATIVDKLLEAGIIIMGKATMSELAFFKGKDIRCGWSAAHGQSQSAYVYGGLDMDDTIAGHSSPLGSSAGSAIAASAGFAPLTVGTETSGSLVAPATRASLYTIKPTLGIVPGEGILPISTKYDTAGPMGKTPKDVADLLTVLVDPSKTSVPSGGYASAIGGKWSDLKVGSLDPDIWTSSAKFVKPVQEASEQMVKETNEAYEKIKTLVKAYHPNISQNTEDVFDIDEKSALQTKLVFGFQEDLNNYLASLKSSKVGNLRELVDWNFQHWETALTPECPNQDLLVSSLFDDHDPERLEKVEAHLRTVGNEFMGLFDKYDVDVIFSPGDGGMYRFSAACGFPIATLPIGTLGFNGRPFGLTIAVRPHQEALLVKVMDLWEATFPGRQQPKAFLERSK